MSRPLSPPFAARAEDRVTRAVTKVLSRRGWIPCVVPFTSYGGDGWIRVVARAVLSRPRGPHAATTRGWRAFFTAPLNGAVVRITVPGYPDEFTATADRQGYLDVRLDATLPPGRHELGLRVGDGPRAVGSMHVVDPAAHFGLVSDIDDTAVITALPRPFVAAWNTFAVHEHARRPVPGMAEFYQAWLSEHQPAPPTFYLSTGAWNTHGLLARFLTTNGYPAGPLLLTDWGPTNTGFFRSGPEHKRAELRRLTVDFPHIRWLLVGDDGQHDPMLYTQFASEHPGNVDAIGIRELTPGEQILAHGTPLPGPDSSNRREVPVHVQVARGADGHQLAWALIPDKPAKPA